MARPSGRGSMTAPKRFKNDPDAGRFERIALKSAKDFEPPKGAKDAIRAVLNAKIGVGAQPSLAHPQGVPASSIAHVTTVASLVKPAVTGALAALVLIGGVTVRERLSAPSRAPTPVVVSTKAPVSTFMPAVNVAPEAQRKAEPSGMAGTGKSVPASESLGPEVAAIKTPISAASTESSKTHTPTRASSHGNDAAVEASEASRALSPADNGHVPTPANATSQLREESLLLTQATEALRAGRAPDALAILDVSRQQFPSALLGQEREALAIEALWSANQRAAASARAQAFVVAHPTSPHAERLKAFVLSP